VVLVKFLTRFGLEALDRDLLFITQLALNSRFYFKGWPVQDWASQRRNSENWTPEWAGRASFI